MNTQKSLYSTRITKVKLEYLKKYYPNIQTEDLLDYAGILPHELEDRGHWLNQEQVDRFSEICLKLTGDMDFHRKTGRYMALSENLAHLKQYTLGFLSPKTAYLLMGMILPMLSRTVSVKTKNLGPRTVEITVQPKTGVQERLFQCEHRTGCFEALGQFFTGQLAGIEHPQCIHRGDKVCRYILSWEDSPSAKWKKLGAAVTLAGVIGAPFLLYFLPLKTAALFLLGFAVLALFFFVYHLRQKKDELSHSLRIQAEVAKDQINEVNLRYNNLMLVQEIAQITSDRLDVVLLIDAVIKAMKRRLDFDRGMVMLADEKATKLYFVAGYGYGNELEEQIHELEFNLTNKEAKGIFVKVFHQQKPLLVEDIENILEDLSPRSSRFAAAAEAKSIICVPIVYERNSLGILVVDKIRSNRPLTQSDIGLLNGIAAHLAASIVIAQSFDKLRESERKYRDLVENAHSIILRRDMDGHITFFNEFAQTLFGYIPENILGKSVLGTLLPDTEQERADLCKTNELFKQNPETRVVKESEHQINSGETLWIAWTLKSVLDHEGNPEEILCIGNDITQIKCNIREPTLYSGSPAVAMSPLDLSLAARGVWPSVFRACLTKASLFSMSLSIASW